MRIKEGSRVTIHYRMHDAQGNLLDQSDEPVTFTVGAGEIIPAFEEALLGMAAGEERTFTLGPDQTFGEYREEFVFWVPKAQLQSGEEEEEPLSVGQTLILSTMDGHTVRVYVRDMNEESVQLDANHPLAGQTLTYSVEVLRVE